MGLLALLALPFSSIGQKVAGVSLERMGNAEIRIEWSTEKGRAYTVEFRDSLVRAAWSPLPPVDRWPIHASSIMATIPPGVPARFFRVVGQQSPAANRGQLLSSQKMGSISALQLSLFLAFAGAGGLPVTHDVGLYKLTYETIDAQGYRTTASGAVAVPLDVPSPVSLVSYQHGTVVAREEVPSRFGAGNIESLASPVLASMGYLAAAPDYLGLGDSPGFHPFVIAKANATAIVDMLLASRQFAAEQGILLTGKVFLMGYSEGGYTTVAAHREIERLHPGGLTVTASAPMAGPYDLSGTMVDAILSDAPFPSPFFLAYAILAYNELYDFFQSPREVFIESVARDVVPLFDGRHTGSELNARLPAVPKQMLLPSFLEAFRTDPNHPLRLALAENDLPDWKAEAPIRLFHCAADRTVPQANSEIALKKFRELGAKEVERIDPFPAGDHARCVLPSFTAAIQWFETLRF